MKLTRHARVELLILTALALGSCGSSAPRTFTSGDYDRLDVADVNARNALSRISDLESRMDDLETKMGR